MWRNWLFAAALGACGACGSRDEEVIRYLVAAEVAERAELAPSRVEVTEVKIRGGAEATAEATYAPLGSRGPEKIHLRCRLTHGTSRWRVQECSAK